MGAILYKKHILVCELTVTVIFGWLRGVSGIRFPISRVVGPWPVLFALVWSVLFGCSD